jgi:hypothetical protein
MQVDGQPAFTSATAFTVLFFFFVLFFRGDAAAVVETHQRLNDVDQCEVVPYIGTRLNINTEG